MRTSDLLLSGLNITEDDYSYKGLCILSSGEKWVHFDISGLDDKLQMEELKEFFDIEDNIEDIRKILMDMIMEKAIISSRSTD